jgi:hypothetical protein
MGKPTISSRMRNYLYKKYSTTHYTMEKVFVISTLVVFLFCIAKFIEMKYLDDEQKPLKYLVRDAIIVFACAGLGTFVYFHMDGSVTDFLNIVTENKALNVSSPQVFTDDPGF